ncbi:MAG: ribonuclease P protein component [Spirochaetales bacterium]|nr:ribonuclease P protein component [Spirochaetales bacterium]
MPFQFKETTKQPISLKKKHIYNLRKQGRIKKSRSILSLIRNGSVLSCPHIKIFFCKNNLKNNRLGILLSKDIGISCLRNTIKRKVREIFRKKISDFEPHYDVLVKIISVKNVIKKRTLEEELLSWYECIKR